MDDVQCTINVVGGLRGISNGSTSIGSDLLRGIVHAFSTKDGVIGHNIGNPWVMRTAASFLGDFAVWFGKQQVSTGFKFDPVFLDCGFVP